MSKKVRRELGDGTNRTALEDGSIVGGYSVTYLASGGQGIVYKGEKLGKVVVLKEVSASNTKDVPSLVSEKTLLERLNHPGLVHYISFLTEDGHYYLVVEYVPGEPLSQFLDTRNPPPVADVADWAVQLCDIFDYLHHQTPPVIYRDLKPENVLLADGKVRLIDFGIARLHKGGDRQKDTELMGSRMTASPEHYGGAETDARSDIYTLGATIYELLTGGRRASPGAFQWAPVRELREDVPPAFEAALTKALQFKPMDRFASAAEFANAILKAMGKPARATARVPIGTAAPAKTRSSGVLLAVVLVAMLAGAGLFKLTADLNAPPPSEYPASTGVQEASLKGNLFGAGKVGKDSVVFMGEDIGLFQVTPWEKETAENRAKTIAERLNRFYQSACLACGGSNLEGPDIRVGRYTATGEVVVFYAHIHGNQPPSHGPLVLATIDEAQAKALGKPARFVAYFWRDMVRDILQLSRGLPVTNSALGNELADAFKKARGQLDPKGETVENLRQILRQTTASQSVKLRELFLKIPATQSKSDGFVNVAGYEPLRD